MWATRREGLETHAGSWMSCRYEAILGLQSHIQITESEAYFVQGIVKHLKSGDRISVGSRENEYITTLTGNFCQEYRRSVDYRFTLHNTYLVLPQCGHLPWQKGSPRVHLRPGIAPKHQQELHTG